MRSSLRPELHPGFCLLLAAMVLFLPLKWCIAFLLVSAFHEVCHLAAIWICHGSVSAFRIGSGGAVIEAEALSEPKLLLCTLAGPLGSVLLIALARWAPHLAICAALQSLFNLLPLQTLDGGQALRCCCKMLMPPNTADKVCRFVHGITLAIAAVMGIYGSIFLGIGLLPLLASVVLILRGSRLKTPCK